MEAALKSSEAKAASGDAQDRSAPVRALERIYFKHVVQGPGGKRAATRREVTALEALLCHVRCPQLEAAVWQRLCVAALTCFLCMFAIRRTDLSQGHDQAVPAPLQPLQHPA